MALGRLVNNLNMRGLPGGDVQGFADEQVGELFPIRRDRHCEVVVSPWLEVFEGVAPLLVTKSFQNLLSLREPDHRLYERLAIRAVHRAPQSGAWLRGRQTHCCAHQKHEQSSP